MSYKGHLVNERFSVKAENFNAAWKILFQNFFKNGYTIPRTLIEIMDDFGLEASVDKKGNITKVEWNSDKNLYNVNDLCLLIASYVVKGSYLRFVDEQGNIITYRFDGTNVDIDCISFSEEDGDNGGEEGSDGEDEE